MALAPGERIVESFVVNDNGLVLVTYVNAASIVTETSGLPRDADGRLVVTYV